MKTRNAKSCRDKRSRNYRTTQLQDQRRRSGGDSGIEKRNLGFLENPSIEKEKGNECPRKRKEREIESVRIRREVEVHLPTNAALLLPWKSKDPNPFPQAEGEREEKLSQ
ncbi:hypothetical protein ACLOJK_017067 [Asimina triloba]